MRRAKISGTGMYVPDRVVTNDDLAKLMDTSDEWIQQRSGIVTRRYVEPGQMPSELAENATRRALESAISDPEFVPADALSGDNVSLVTAHTRLTLSPRISYQFSNRVSADFTLRYEKFDSEEERKRREEEFLARYRGK